ncbi:serine protease [Sporosarcina sp. HYO08]|uniref:S1 family peptidase n=1 Tax=Sporosarcina sp. HYO08 TaxID=1759557 RepID=UPI00079806CB|nr:serine protease [Sporosarcina sp. HYO08]KXH81880.1 peptidase S7 [Sporosarcina sp. HYO08]
MPTNEKRIDEQLEESEEELIERLALEAQADIRQKDLQNRSGQKRKRPFHKMLIWLMSISLTLSTFLFIFEVYSIPAIEFLKVSAKLSAREDIASYKKSVVVVLTEDSKGTGFSIDQGGTIVTNYHVIEGSETATVTFPELGRFSATVAKTYPDIDLAVLEIKDAVSFPSLPLAKSNDYVRKAAVYFIGNPLYFTGIANEGTLLEPILLQDWPESVMMMKAPVYRGNSGSPVLNENGQVIGIVFATLDHDAYGKVGLFVPIELYKLYASKN